MKLALLTPTLDPMPSIPVESWLNLVRPVEFVTHRFVVGKPVADAYNEGFEGLIRDYQLGAGDLVVTVEWDNLLPPLTLVRLIGSAQRHWEYAAIGALYFTKGTKLPQIWGPPGFKPQVLRDDGGLQECAAVGMGCTAFRAEVFERARYPWFKTVLASADAPGMDQCLYFWSWAGKEGLRCAVDTSIVVGHVDRHSGVVW